jgi:thioredoxin-related protein
MPFSNLHATWNPCRSFMVLAFAAIALISYSAETQAAGDPRDPRAYFFSQTFGDLPEELEEAREAGKIGLVLFFEQEGCPYCRYMMQNVLNQPDLQDWYRERFVSIAVDINGDVELRDIDGITLPSKVFAAHRKVKTTPVISFIDLQGTEVFRRVDTVKSAAEFLLMGRYVAEQHFTDTSWGDFQQAHGAGSEDEARIPMVDDFQADGRAAAQRGVPILLAVTREGCPYCARLRRDFLSPMIRSGEYREKALIREMMMEPDSEVLDFDGLGTSTAKMARAWGVGITPTVLLLDSRGRTLHQPIVGINNSEMYGYYLDRAIELAQSAAAARPDPAKEGRSP